MRERPIIFSAPMVRAILAGTKTQTRRVVKPVGNDDGFAMQDYGDGWWPYRSDDGESPMKGGNEIPHACPYGQPGDRLWVKETWARDSADGALFYRADVGTGNEADDWQHNIDVGAPGYRWRPPIHMPRWASRITLEVTGVRVERLLDISADDAWAEGIEHSPDVNPVHQYIELWESINGQGSWNANPWVWVIEFRRAEGDAP